MSNLQDKILIVTGSTGIGAATARLAAAAAGARLLIATNDAGTGWELAQETGGEVWVGDLTRPASAASILGQCIARFGRVDALFNVAGLSGRRFGDGPVHECSDEGWEITLSHNLQIAFQMSRAIIGRMLEQDVDENGVRGAILNMGSILTDLPEPRHFATHAYAAAKGAIAAMTRSMASYYAPHRIRVNAIAPAIVGTPVSRASEDSDLVALIRKKQPLTEGMIDPEDVARAALFLLSDDARSITGEVLAVDGGWKVSGA